MPAQDVQAFLYKLNRLLPKSDVVNIPVMYDEKTEQMCYTERDFENFSTVSTFKLL